MKKLLLKKLIRESIIQEQGATPQFHVWGYLSSPQGVPGCNNLPLNWGYNCAVYSYDIPGGAYTAGAMNTPVGAAAQTAVWQYLGSPSVGQVVKIKDHLNRDFCLEYGGASSTQTVPNCSLGITSGPLGTFSDCQTCYDGPQPPMVRCACCDRDGMPISMAQQVPATQGCDGTENTIYAGLSVVNCALSQADGGPGPNCPGAKPGPFPTNPTLNPSSLVAKPEDNLAKFNARDRMQKLANIRK